MSPNSTLINDMSAKDYKGKTKKTPIEGRRGMFKIEVKMLHGERQRRSIKEIFEFIGDTDSKHEVQNKKELTS